MKNWIIGKNLVRMMMESKGLGVIDMRIGRLLGGNALEAVHNNVVLDEIANMALTTKI